MLNTVNKDKLVNEHYKTPSKLSFRKEYNRKAKPNTKFTDDIIDLIKELKPKNIIDVGCGYGDILIRIRESGYTGELTGVEISKGMLKDVLDHPSINFQVGDAQDLKFDNNSFDMVICKHMLYHLPDPQKGIDEIYRVLNDNGTLVITLNSKDNKPKFFEIEKKVCKLFNTHTEHGQELVNVENVPDLLSKFKDIKTIYKTGYIEHPELFVEFFDSFKDNYDPVPENWSDVLEFVKKNIPEVETNKTGMIIAKK